MTTYTEAEASVESIRPTDDRLILKRDDAEERTRGGIILPDKSREKPVRGQIVRIGPGSLAKDGSRREMAVQVGDRVLFNAYAGSPLKFVEGEFLLLRESDIVAVIEE